ncbi:MAG: MmgE/PrpD family protein [Lautropia sp.]
MTQPRRTQPEPLGTAIARWACTLRPEDVPAARHRRMRVALLDFLGCVLAGSALPEAAQARALAQPGSTKVPGSDRDVDLASAIVAWGATGALLQWHDGYGRGGNHPSSSILPVLMAQSQDWPRMLMPAIVGYETANRLAALTHPRQTLAGSAPTASMGAIGAAVALCRWEALDESTTARALGLAGFWSPIAAFEGLRARGSGVPLHSGLAARAGWEAVQAAKAGLEASPTLLEGAGGPGLLQFLGGADVRTSAPADPATWRGETLDQVYLKGFPGCRHVHPAVEAALGLRASVPPDPARWRRISLRTYRVALGFGALPRPGHELYDCLMSLPWCVALALLEGAPDLAAVTRERGRAPLRALSRRIEVGESAAHEAHYPAHLGATIEIVLDDGTAHVQDAVLRYADAGEHFSPVGPFGPVLDEAGARAKFLRLARSAGPVAEAEAEAAGVRWQRVADEILAADPTRIGEPKHHAA